MRYTESYQKQGQHNCCFILLNIHNRHPLNVRHALNHSHINEVNSKFRYQNLLDDPSKLHPPPERAFQVVFHTEGM